MPIRFLQNSAMSPVKLSPKARTLIWFGLSLLFTLILAGIHWQQAFSREYIVQDDARQHVFWMLRFVDPELFPNDRIADYFQTVAPQGYTALYQAAIALGIDPFLLNRVLPGILGLITTAYCFGVSLQLLPIPFAGFLASVLLNQNLILADDLYSATPRAFVYPLFLAFLYYLLNRSLLLCLGTIALLGWFYPQLMLVACGILVLRLVSWKEGRLRLNRDRANIRFAVLGLGVGAAVILPYLLESSSQFGPAITATAAYQMPEFWREGRGSFFNPSPFDFWLFADRSGVIPRPTRLLKPPLLLAALALPFLLRRPDRFPLGQKVTANVAVLGQTMLASIGLFFAAHALLFRLHHPSRYTQHSLRIVLALGAGIVLAILVDALFHWASQPKTRRKQAIALGSVTLAGLLLAGYLATVPLARAVPLLEWIFPDRILPGWVIGSSIPLYEFFAQQPKDVMIAALTGEADNLPTFSHRSVLVAKEYGIPYHVGYYDEFRTRTIALIRAHYSTDPMVVRQFTEKYGIDFWLIDRNAFSPDYRAFRRWLHQYQPATREAIATLEQGKQPVLQQAIDRCTVLSTADLLVLQASCIADPAKLP